MAKSERTGWFLGAIGVLVMVTLGTGALILYVIGFFLSHSDND